MADKAKTGLKHTVAQVDLRDDDAQRDTRETKRDMEMGLCMSTNQRADASSS